MIGDLIFSFSVALLSIVLYVSAKAKEKSLYPIYAYTEKVLSLDAYKIFVDTFFGNIPIAKELKSDEDLFVSWQNSFIKYDDYRACEIFSKEASTKLNYPFEFNEAVYRSGIKSMENLYEEAKESDA